VLWHVSRGVVGSVGVEWQAWVSLRVRWCGVLTPGPTKRVLDAFCVGCKLTLYTVLEAWTQRIRSRLRLQHATKCVVLLWGDHSTTTA
jgi:hypothetical protein